ncbi:hypothetical protein RVR_6640 [Actinacidiphila reveromycinica]|uniref:DUF4190 domain-containing protein n=1 Tax=Actinacidiphila reveromycinica TaxID=659352 RepID=A0A7U3UVW2_9ACTN|nr:DUF4190 domain-containing protein [Streptomyces sp. SN-593]BBA99842.1 hypothetical protein RVR_6640 [Streptomyces sp. SN-593]
MDISPPPPPEDQSPPAAGYPGGPPPPPPAPAPPYAGSGSPYDSGRSYGYPQTPYGQPSPYGGEGQPPYGSSGPGPYQQPNPNPYAAPGAQGMPGPYPYPVPQQGWYAANRTTNGLSIASLVTSFSCIPLLGLGLGIAGLKQGRRQGQRGRGLAIAGITINSVTTLLTVLLITLGALGVIGDDGNTKVQDIKAGQCFNTTGHSLSDIEQGSKASRRVNVVDCDQAHEAEAYYTYTLDPSTSGSYPGIDAITSEAQSTCGKQMGTYLDGHSLQDGMRLFFFGPEKSLWETGDRSVTCFFGDVDGKVTGSVRDGGSSDDGSGGGADGGSDGGSTGGSDDGGDTGVGV